MSCSIYAGVEILHQVPLGPEGAAMMGRGGPNGTLKDFKKGLNRFMERRGMREKMVSPGRWVSAAEVKDPEWQARNEANKRKRA